jgi:tartronate-semialdehyde synthase
MPKMNMMDAVVRVMESEGVDVVFGVPGPAILPLYKALAKSDIKHVSVRHEEGTHAADGYARLRAGHRQGRGEHRDVRPGRHAHDHRPLHTAMADSIPMICITGQAPTDVLHKEAFQAVDIVEIAKPATKWAVQVKETAQLPWAFRQAFRIAREGRPGPVLIDLPLNVQKGHRGRLGPGLGPRTRLRPPDAEPGRDPRGRRHAAAGRAADAHAGRRGHPR